MGRLSLFIGQSGTRTTELEANAYTPAMKEAYLSEAERILRMSADGRFLATVAAQASDYLVLWL